jgi:hypothetical protein
MAKVIDVHTTVLSAQAGQTTHAEVTMEMECVAATEQTPERDLARLR